MRAVDAGPPATAWRRVHPLTPLFSAGGVVVVILTATVFSNLEVMIDILGSSAVRSMGIFTALLAFLGGLILIALIVGAYGYLAWRQISFALTPDAVWYRSGIVFRNQRHARLERIQSVEIIHPLLGRIVGVGKLRIEVAGSTGSSFTIEYLKSDQLEAVRSEILTRSAEYLSTGPIYSGTESIPGATTSPEVAGPFPAKAPLEAETPLYAVPFGRLLGSVLLSPWMALAAIVMVALGVVAVVAITVGGTKMVWSLFPMLPGFFAVFSVALAGLSGAINFRAAVAPTGVRIRRGFAQTSAETIPARRIHAVQISQPLFWRLFGWHRVRLTQIGGQSGDSDATNRDLLLPVGTKDQALLALWLVVPDLQVPHPEQLLEAALEGSGPQGGFTVNPSKSRLFDPLTYRRSGVCATPTCLIIRGGRLDRKVTVVPYARMQSVGWQQGPWQRKLGLASLSFHVVPGRIRPRLQHLGCSEARRLLSFVVEHAGAARNEETPQRWLARTQERLEAGSQ